MRRRGGVGEEEEVLVQVQDNMYEVNLKTRRCCPIYLKSGRKMKVQRCLWYRDTNEPFDERVSDEIERRHVELFREALLAKLSGEALPNTTAATASAIVSSDEGFEVISTDSAISSATGSNKSSKNSKSDTPKTQIERNLISPTSFYITLLIYYIYIILALSSLIFEDGTITWFSENEVFLEKSKTVLDKMSDLLKYNKSKICKF